MKLLIDLGNTRLKWAALNTGRMQPGGVFAHIGKPLAMELRTEWAEFARVGAIFVASVVAPAREEELDAFVHERFGLHAQFVRSPAVALGVRNAYEEPARLGVDRFLALAAAHVQHARAQILVGAGTALTVDALDADGTHLGGLIVASPRLMRSAVLAGTARVNVADGICRDLPRSTADAVVTGSLYAAAGAIDRFRAKVAQRLGAPPAVILSGGGGDEIEALIAPVERAHDLVLHGLALWAEAFAQDR
ncbi:MAG: type III pantothenate kinase [Dokdonella sp.]